jgi:hypothetical protein
MYIYIYIHGCWGSSQKLVLRPLARAAAGGDDDD